MNEKFIPFSKKNVIYARFEAYIFSIVLIIMVWCNKDVSAIAILLSLAWGGYKLIQVFYINMAKYEHLMDKKIEYSKLGIDTSELDEKINDLETTDISVEE
jgi:hypothetical protein